MTIKTLYTTLHRAAMRHANKTALRWKENGAWRRMSFQNLLASIDALSGGLANLGVEKNANVIIWSENRPEWLMSDFALNKLGATSVPIHGVANKSFAEFIFTDSESKIIIVSETIFEKHRACRWNIFKTVIIIGQSLPEAHPEHAILFSDLLAPENRAIAKKPRVGNLASILYTSGTTGDPKGVMLTNENFMANIAAVSDCVAVLPTDTLLSFLPLSHVLERMAGQYLPIFQGATIAYAQSPQTLVADCKIVKPTILVSVPKIYERICDTVFSQVNAGSNLKKQIFYWGLKQSENPYTRPLASFLVYRKIKNIFGGRLRFAVSGGAAIHPRILKFFNKVGMTILEGYGLTETSPVIAMNRIEKSKIGTVGGILKNLEVKLSPEKEILVKGPSVMRGYWKRNDLTKTALTNDGWLKTGDLGSFDEHKNLTIIGRKKEIIVASTGENVAPEKIENILTLNSNIAQALVVGHRKSFLVALIVPERAALENPDLIQKELDIINEKQLMPFERIKKFKIVTVPFSIESGELTPTLKIKRNVIEEKYKSLIEEMYRE